VEGKKLVGDLYVPDSSKGHPFVIFLHGSCPEAGRLLLYRELGARLSAAGCTVLVIDQRGHGRSEHIDRVNSPRDVDFVSDAAQLGRDAAGVLGVRGASSTVVAGHSFGGGVAAAVIGRPGVDGVISISPGRRIGERFLAPGTGDGLGYVQERKSQDMHLSSPIPLDVVAAMLASYDIGKLAHRTVPEPLLIIEGALEPESDLEFTGALVQSIGGSVRHVVIPEADHYYGVSMDLSGEGRKWMVTREDVVQALVDAMIRWIRDLPGETRPGG
jgi:pimeloyl-ACP methyl ester carboxylesterase